MLLSYRITAYYANKDFIESSTTATTTTQTTTHEPLAVPQSPARRGPRTSRKVSAQVTKLEAVDDTSDPLGPLGESTITEEAPTPPLKETVGARAAQPAYSAAQSSAGASVDRSEEQQRTVNPPPVQFPGTEAAQKRQTQPSISVEQAAKPTFNITVGDPHKVGDLTSSHIVYQIRTKVSALNLKIISSLIAIDYVKSIPPTRIRSQSPLQRLSMDLQPTTQQQPRCRRSPTTRETSRWPFRYQLCRISTSCFGAHDQQDCGASHSSA